MIGPVSFLSLFNPKNLNPTFTFTSSMDFILKRKKEKKFYIPCKLHQWILSWLLLQLCWMNSFQGSISWQETCMLSQYPQLMQILKVQECHRNSTWVWTSWNLPSEREIERERKKEREREKREDRSFGFTKDHRRLRQQQSQRENIG